MQSVAKVDVDSSNRRRHTYCVQHVSFGN